MALTSGAWTVTTVNGLMVLECDVIHGTTTIDYDAWTLKTPAKTIDPTKPWVLFANTAGATLDAEALAVDIWAGYDDDFVLTASAVTVAVTSGGIVVNGAIDDVKSTQLNVIVDPNHKVAQVPTTLAGTAGIVNAGVAPYYIFNLDGAATGLAAETCHWVITQ